MKSERATETAVNFKQAMVNWMAARLLDAASVALRLIIGPLPFRCQCVSSVLGSGLPTLLKRARSAVVLLAVAAPLLLSASVVINEIFYNAPEDWDDLQWIEIHNTSDQAADLAGWALDDGKIYTFPAGTTLPAKGYLVVALDLKRFAQFYKEHALGPLKRPLKRGGEKLSLKDAWGKVIDSARFQDRAPWAVSADGCSASLERICPAASGDTAENWAASPLPPLPKPSGTPGRQNTSYSATLPPGLALSPAPATIEPGQPLSVEAEVKGNARELTLLYRVVTLGVESKETSLPMTNQSGARFSASIPPQTAGSLVRYRVKIAGADGSTRFVPDEQALRPAMSVFVHEKWDKGKVPFAFVLCGGSDKSAREKARNPSPGPGPRFEGRGMGGRGPQPNFSGPDREEPRPPRGASTFLFVDRETGIVKLFDFVNAVPRNNNRGFKIFFHKDLPLDGMSSINLVFEGSEWSLLAETMAYDVYRRAGCPAPLTKFVRVWADGQLLGHHLLVERPNRSFLRRNQIDDNGNLYKAFWMGRDIAGQHEKCTRKQSDHSDLLAVVDQLNKSKNTPDQQWQIIQQNFDVDEVAAYFAVNMVLSHWDGFFNNYYLYHDLKRNKWQFYPWDQDKTWGYYDGLPDDQVFFDMPLTYGTDGDQPPGASATQTGNPFGGGRGGAAWWRPGGHFSRPLLGNPHFRKIYLQRTRDLLEKTYTQANYFPPIDGLVTLLTEEAEIRAKLRGESADAGKKLLARDAQLLKTHLDKRRQFLLQQPELKSLNSQ
jgi:hypothetical protein